MATKTKRQLRFEIDTAIRVSVPLAIEAAAFRGFDALDDARTLRQLQPVINHKTEIAAVTEARRIALNTFAIDRIARLTEGGEVAQMAQGAVDMAYAIVPHRAAAYAACAVVRGVGRASDYIGTAQRVQALGPRSAWFIRMLDLDVHGVAELETAMVAVDYALERGGGYDDQMRMETLRRFQPIIAGIEAGGFISFHSPSNVSNRFRRPVWAGLPGAEAAHPYWATFLSWPAKVAYEWIVALADAVGKTAL